MTGMNDVADRHGLNASKKSKRLREAVVEVMRTAECKFFCHKELGSAPSDFITREYTHNSSSG